MATVFSDSPLPTASRIADDDLAEIGVILATRRNFGIADYRANCMKRRVAIRMRASRCHTSAEYCRLLRHSEQELDLLQKTLTIHISQFFRNPSLFDTLRQRVLPDLFAVALTRPDKSLSIRSLGCAGGEEPYSLAILLREHFPRELALTTTLIAGIDIDTETLETARLGEYDGDRLAAMPAELLSRYFRRQGERFRLSDEIREMVTFSRENIADRGRYPACDMVLCRNTLIYFTRPEQERILEDIAGMLPRGGILVLGKSETMLGTTRRRFTPICPVERIYRRIG